MLFHFISTMLHLHLILLILIPLVSSLPPIPKSGGTGASHPLPPPTQREQIRAARIEEYNDWRVEAMAVEL